MEAATQNVANTFVPLNNARSIQNSSMYLSNENLVDTFNKTKDYLFTNLDSNSVQYKAISKIKSKKHKELRLYCKTCTKLTVQAFFLQTMFQSKRLNHRLNNFILPPKHFNLPPKHFKPSPKHLRPPPKHFNLPPSSYCSLHAILYSKKTIRVNPRCAASENSASKKNSTVQRKPKASNSKH